MLTQPVDPGGLEADAEWDAVVAAVGGRHAQTTAWARVKAATEWRAERVEVRQHGRIVAGAQVLTRRLPLLGRLGYLDGGPVVVDPTAVGAVVDALVALCRRAHIRNLVVDLPEGSEAMVEPLLRRGFVPSQVKTALAATLVVDLTRSEEAILAGMRSSTRRNIKKGERAGTVVRKGDRDDLPVVAELFGATADRQGFIPADERYLRTLYDELDPLGQCVLMIAEADGAPVAAMLGIVFGDRIVYKRGGWSGTHRDARPNEVMHWATMRWAKAAGLRRYDFDGIEPAVARAIATATEGPEPTHVTRFKLGFGGDVVLLPDSLSYLPNRVVRVGYTRVFPRVRRLKVVKRALKRLRAR
jgi:lipid II:glycine glycyltransferase (peptidoglycan interpeptide bridge formation enzyme)